MSPTRAGCWMRGAATAVALVAACLAAGAPTRAAQEPPHSAELDEMIIKAAQRHGVPERLVRRIVMRESRYNPHARNHKYWGLMQISYPTARSMGFKGTPEQLLNPLTNLTYAVPYLANAFIAAGKREDAAVRLYASGYYDTARRMGVLGLLRTAESAPAPGFQEVAVAAAAPAESSFGIFGALIGPSDPPPVTAMAAAPPIDGVTAAGPDVATQRSGKGDGGVDMVADKAGHAGPPPKWRRDGGVSVLARGEQGIEHVAAYAERQGKSGGPQKADRHARKTTEFASLDTPAAAPSSAQAYAGSDGTAAPPQAAIAQVIAATPAAGATDAAPDRGGDADRPARKKRRKIAEKHHAVASTDAPAAPSVAELRP